MTPETLAELRRLAAEATPGPWAAQHNEDDEATVGALSIPEMCGSGCLAVFGAMGETDAEFTAAARNALPDILDELEALRSEITRRDAVVEAANKWAECTDDTVDCPHADALLDALTALDAASKEGAGDGHRTPACEQDQDEPDQPQPRGPGARRTAL